MIINRGFCLSLVAIPASKISETPTATDHCEADISEDEQHNSELKKLFEHKKKRSLSHDKKKKKKDISLSQKKGTV